MYRKSNTETCITICKLDSQQEFAVCLSKLKQGLCINLEGWDWERDGRKFQKGVGICIYRTSLVAQMVKHLLIMWETWVQSLGQEDPLEKEMTTHSSILAWKIPWTEEPGGLPSLRSHRVGHDWSDLARLIQVEVWQKTTKFCKAKILQFKNK